MSELDEFEQELRRLNKTRERLQWLLVVPVFLFACAVRSAIWFVVVALVTAGLAWLFGSNEPREVAMFWGWLSVPLACIWTVTLVWSASK